MVRLSRASSFSNSKSGSESENMDVDPEFSGSSSGRRSTRYSARRQSDLNDQGTRRSVRAVARKNFYVESSDSDLSESEEEVNDPGVEAGSSQATVDGNLESEEQMPSSRPKRNATKNSWLYQQAKLDRPRRSSRWALRSTRGAYQDDDTEAVVVHEEDSRSSEVVVKEENQAQEDEEGQTENATGVTRRRRVKVVEYSEPEPEAEAGGDMYSRLKERSSKRSARVDYREQKRMSRRGHETDDEPIRRRLRERKSNLTYHEETRSAIDDLLRKAGRHKRKKRHNRSSSSSSGSSDSSIDPRSRNRRDKAEKAGSKTGFVDLQPNEVDPSVTFASVGGLHQIIEKLRETVILPLVYKEFYADRGIAPPKGVLFHGPPGTGKTMLARALVNECSTLAGQKVTFFVRKGGDLLSKWVGESEKQLRRLFEEASKHQPCIIFFDEIDGLAPVRSSKTDQVHNSVVSTLLAELDGVKDRGDIIIIGATNRIESIDPALRRPGRFDHEFGFYLPTEQGRMEIIRSHTRKWKSDQVAEQVLEELAKLTAGYSGADLKLLCAEASVSALRRRYPQIYTSTNKYLLDYESIKVEYSDWLKAMEKIKPSSSRVADSIITTGKPLPAAVVPLLQDVVDDFQKSISVVFPLADKPHLMNEPGPKRFLIYAQHNDSGIDQYIVPALLHSFESVPVFVLNFESSIRSDSGSEAAAVMAVFNEADRIKRLAIILIPSINILVRGLTPQGQEFLYQQIMKCSGKPVFILATMEPQTQRLEDAGDSDSPGDIPSSVVMLFKGVTKKLHPISVDARKKFFSAVLSEKSISVKKEVERKASSSEELPLAPPPPPKPPSPEDQRKHERKEAMYHRRLRKFLREVLGKLARNKKFQDFLSPVDEKEVPDYYQIIKNPICLEDMMCKLDMGKYMSASEFLADINLIRDNAIEYNPPHTPEGKSIRHAAHELVDHANIIIDDEMNSDFENECLSIIERRKMREATTGVPPSEGNHPVSNGIGSTPQAGSSKDTTASEGLANGHTDNATSMFNGGSCKRKLRWAHGHTHKQRKISASKSVTPSVSPEAPSAGSSLTATAEHSPAESVVSSPLDEAIYVKAPHHDEYAKQLKKLLSMATEVTDGVGINGMLELRYQLLVSIDKFHSLEDKSQLIDEMRVIINDFRNVHSAP